jgi:hypothetical protein
MLTIIDKKSGLRNENKMKILQSKPNLVLSSSIWTWILSGRSCLFTNLRISNGYIEWKGKRKIQIHNNSSSFVDNLLRFFVSFLSKYQVLSVEFREKISPRSAWVTSSTRNGQMILWILLINIYVVFSQNKAILKLQEIHPSGHYLAVAIVLSLVSVFETLGYRALYFVTRSAQSPG